MIIEQPKKTVEVCDFCRRDGTLTTCWACGKRYCCVDEAIISGGYSFYHLCRACGDREDVLRVIHKWAKRLERVYNQRDAELQELLPRARKGKSA